MIKITVNLLNIVKKNKETQTFSYEVEDNNQHPFLGIIMFNSATQRLATHLPGNPNKKSKQALQNQ